MNAETKTCQNCKRQFVIEPEDFGFYEKMGVDAPNLCPQCGVQYFMAFRNERVLYRRQCDKCKKDTLSLYHPKAEYVVYCHDCWWADDWDGTDYAMKYDPSRPFFEQFKELQRKVPREALIIVNSQNCDYGNNIRDSKNCYFCFLIATSENLLYSMWITNQTRDCIASRKVVSSELVAYCTDIVRCNNSTFLKESSDCVNCHFSFDLRGCSNCILSSNLRNKSYCIRNKQYTKEEYEKEAAKILTGSHADLEALQQEYVELQQKALHRYATGLNSRDVVGNYLQDCSQCTWIFDGFNTEQSKAVASVLNAKNSHYSYSIGIQPSEFNYGVSVVKGGANIKFSFNLFNCFDATFCDSMLSSSHCIGSVGVKKKEYCILNKQYSKEEYSKFADQLLKEPGLRNFPPKAFSAFAYNETCAQDYYSLTKEQALSQGYLWQDDIPFTSGKETLQPENIPDSIAALDDSILQDVLRCVECARNYRIVADELTMYRRMKLPIPRNCPQCRLQHLHLERLPFKLWSRDCSCPGGASHFHGDTACPNTFMTSFAPDRPEIVYCEQCYQAEVS
jgi:hypothetical protein